MKWVVRGDILVSGTDVSTQVQLIDVMDGSVAWTDRFRNDSASVFEVMEDIAKHICIQLHLPIREGTLKTKLTSKAQHDLLNLEAEKILFSTESHDRQGRMLDLWERALEHEENLPTLASASDFIYWPYVNGSHQNADSAIQLMQVKIDKMMEIDSTAGYTYWVQAMQAQIKGDYTAMYALLEKASLTYDNPLVQCVVGFHLANEKGLRLCLNSLDKDPLHRWGLFNTGHLYLLLNEERASIEMMDKFGRIVPGRKALADEYQALAYGYLSEYDTALEIISNSENLHADTQLYLEICLRAMMGNQAKSRELIEQARKKWEGEVCWTFDLAVFSALRKDYDQAFTSLQEALQTNCGRVVTAYRDPLLRNLHDDPRWDEFLRELGFPEERISQM